jgi:hypothetical protein
MKLGNSIAGEINAQRLLNVRCGVGFWWFSIPLLYRDSIYGISLTMSSLRNHVANVVRLNGTK